MKTFDFEQRSSEWYAIRCGIPTASNLDKIITSKGDPSKQKKKYLYKIAGEFITKVPEETYQNAAMIRGCEMEDEARNLYQIVTGEEVTQVGFCLYEGVFKFGCSPDGLVGEKGLVEIKCPNLATHVGYLLENVLPTDYFQQVQGQLLATERKWCDFVSYYPGIRPLIIRVKRDEKFITALKIELELLCSALEDVVKKIR